MKKLELTFKTKLVILTLAALVLIYFTPTFVECIYHIQDWWNYYHFMPCLPCGAVV